MKKTIFLFIAVILLLSCCTRGRYSARLVAADSLMNAHPDSAYAILKSISSDTLPSKADRAYYALLFTQAMYKNYDTIRSDSLINIAVNFFSDNHDREKYTRSLIYKGAALSDMGKDTKAIWWLLMAEDNAPENDYFYRGYAVYMMGDIYRHTYSEISKTIEKYKIAYNYYRIINNKRYIQPTASMLGGMYTITNLDSAYKYLNISLELSKEFHDSIEIFDNMEMMSKALYYDSNYIESKNMAVMAIKKGRKYLRNFDSYYDAASAYSKLGMTDSALYYLNLTPNERKDINAVSRLLSLINYYKAAKNYKNVVSFGDTVDSKAKVIEKRINGAELIKTENIYNQTKAIAKKHENMNVLALLSSSFFLILIVVLLIAWIIIVRKRAQMRNYQELITRLQEEKSESKISLLQNIDKESKLQSILQNQIVNIRDLIDLSFRYESKPSVFIKLFHEKMKYTKLPDSFWLDLRHYVNLCHNNVLTEIHGRFPSLNDDEMNLISLLCCDFSYIEITICMGYTNAHYVSNKKARIARKMGLSVSLKEYLDELIAQRRQ